MKRYEAFPERGLLSMADDHHVVYGVRWTDEDPETHGEVVEVPYVRADLHRGAVEERDRMREALDWIYAEPEDPIKVQLWARAALGHDRDVLRHCEREIVRALAQTGSTQSQVTHADRFQIATDDVVVKVWTADAYERERGAVEMLRAIAAMDPHDGHVQQDAARSWLEDHDPQS